MLGAALEKVVAPPTTCRLPVHIQNWCRGLGINQEKSPQNHSHFSCLPQGLLWSSPYRVGGPLQVMQVGNISMEFSFALHAWREHRRISALAQVLFALLTSLIFVPYT